jgi:hypothetical protein
VVVPFSVDDVERERVDQQECVGEGGVCRLLASRLVSGVSVATGSCGLYGGCE